MQVFKIVMTDLGHLQQVQLALDEGSKSEGWYSYRVRPVACGTMLCFALLTGSWSALT